MDALILSCGTGGGHNSACAAIAQELSRRGHGAKTLNPYTLKSDLTASTVNSAYNVLAQRVPSAFGMAYHLGNAYRRLPVSSPVYRINKRMMPFLEQYLEENRFDAVVTTHLFPAEILTGMKRVGKAVPKTYFIATDYVCIPFTEETDCDYYIIPAKELTEDFVGRGIPRERILPLGIPVLHEFSEKEDPFVIRQRLGLEPDRKYIFVAGGSIGAGQIEQVVAVLLDHYEREEAALIVVCGNNRPLYENLERNFGRQCTVLKYTSRMADYIKACDLFISKPGGLSSTEAAVAGAALIHITPIPGCETLNMQFFAKNGMCIPVTAPKKQLTDACDRLLDEDLRKSMRASQQRIIPGNAASAICDLMEKEWKRNT